MKLVFHVAPQRRLIIVAHAVEQMKAFAQHRWWHAEAGGVLLGRHLLGSEHTVIDEVTIPQRTDRRGRCRFFRSKKHETLARRRWQEQMSTMAYLGLWHTHPEDDPTPSSIDRTDWQQTVARDTFEGNHLFFPIIGRRHIRVWCLNRRGSFRELRELKKGAKDG